MKPIVKYQGGKTRELPIIKELAPPTFERVVEPFAGGAAVSFHYGYPSVLNDLNRQVINLYRVVGGSDYPTLQLRVDELKGFDHDQLSEQYYIARDIINDPENNTPLDNAISYIIVRQLCFSGMERYNSDGKFNVPFGHYQKFSCNLTPDHHQFLSSRVDLTEGDAIDVINSCNEDDFLFLDPPYLDRLGYIEGDGGNGLHTRLVEAMQTTKAKWLFIHSDCEFYRNNLSEFDIQTKAFRYSQIFGKNKNHSGAKVDHIYVKNY